MHERSNTHSTPYTTYQQPFNASINADPHYIHTNEITTGTTTSNANACCCVLCNDPVRYGSNSAHLSVISKRIQRSNQLPPDDKSGRLPDRIRIVQLTMLSIFLPSLCLSFDKEGIIFFQA